MDSELTFIGADPGVDGCVVILSDDGKVTKVPYDAREYRNALMGLDPTRSFALVEHVNGRPSFQCSGLANFRLGENFGYIQGLLTAFAIPFELIRPQAWKKEFGCTSDKNTSIEVARRLYPGVDLRRTDKCKKDHDGVAEALLLAELAKRRRTHG